jgi:hypothetical protein
LRLQLCSSILGEVTACSLELFLLQQSGDQRVAGEPVTQLLQTANGCNGFGGGLCLPCWRKGPDFTGRLEM